MSNTPVVATLGITNVETGSKLREHHRLVEGSPLVKMLANCEVVGTWRTRTSSMMTRSWTKWRLISTCCTGLVERCTTLTFFYRKNCGGGSHNEILIKRDKKILIANNLAIFTTISHQKGERTEIKKKRNEDPISEI
jgi:hypothetical protein